MNLNAFYFIGLNSTINFTEISTPINFTEIPETWNGSYYNNSHSFVEENVYKPGVWCIYYYHVAVTPKFKELKY